MVACASPDSKVRPVSGSSAGSSRAIHRPSRRVRAYIGLGANLGDATATLAWAVGELAALPGVRVRRVSRLWATAPWGVTDQPEFRNAVVAIDVVLPADATAVAAALGLLASLKAVERAAGRRPGRRWGPRELDLDLLVFGRHRIRMDRPPAARSLEAGTDPAKAARPLQVPHRDAGDRLFVLAPLADVASGLVPPGWSTTVQARRRDVAATEPADAVRVVGTWDPRQGRWISG
jgi:2-amino-4-hydroxy-6-hydroxymethyldihydropteridine diphosphokinase